MQRRLNCVKCGGWGEWHEQEQGYNLVKCDLCNGSGVQPKSSATPREK